VGRPGTGTGSAKALAEMNDAIPTESSKGFFGKGNQPLSKELGASGGKATVTIRIIEEKTTFRE
jgi:hypothetical protein